MFRFAVAVALLAGSAAFGQNADSSSFQVRFASNLIAGDSVVNITNTGASNGAMCVHVYAYTPDEQMASCCSCYVTINGLNSLSVRQDLASNPLTPVIPTALVIKLLATSDGGGGAASCNPGQPGPQVPGLLAWGSTLHALPISAVAPVTTYGLESTPFLSATLHPQELTRMKWLCGFIRANGSGYGMCKSCRLGGLGADVR
jgi:hypothetical protein